MIPISDSIPARRFPFINIAIILATLYVFFLQITAPDPETFIYTWALVPSQVDFTNYATLIPFVTAIFLHGGFLHIGSNMLFLWVFGDNVEGHLDWFFYPVLYFLAGIIGNVVQYFMMPTATIPMLGASGAVAGVLGAYYTLFSHAKIKTVVPIFFFLTILNIPAGFMLGYWFVLQLFSGAASISASTDMGGVAFWAHIGGFVVGVIFAKLMKPIAFHPV